MEMLELIQTMASPAQVGAAIRSGRDLRAVAPLAGGLVARRIDHGAVAVLLAIAPLAAVLAAVRPREGAFALPQVLVVPAGVHGAVWPLHGAISVHVAALPLADIGAAICEVVGAIAVHLVMVELPGEDHVAGARLVGATAVLAAVQELALVAGAVGPAFDALAALLVLRPLALVGGAVLMNVLSVAMGAVLVPLPLVDVAVRGHELALAVGPAADEGALVPRTVGPAQDAMPVALRAPPLALVLCAGFHLSLRALHELLVRARARALYRAQRRLIDDRVSCDRIERLIDIAVLGAASTTTKHCDTVQEHRQKVVGTAQRLLQ
mmetsp:Transcript_34929/g.100352  ORF Transcript_34929/g.100352 Transcript_34929/m.100352 type:complete len:323 (-) Transcript_34929:15-983(-)